MSGGRKYLDNNRTLCTGGIEKSWTPIFQVKRQFPVGRYKSVMVLREQFPLRFAAAKKWHRCQGDTMNSVLIFLEDILLMHTMLLLAESEPWMISSSGIYEKKSIH